MDQAVEELRALAHPLRVRILSLLTGNPMSAAVVARELGTTHANASYHLRLLAQAEMLEEAGEETIRGGVAKRYRYRIGGGNPRAGDRDGFVTALFAELGRRLPERATGGNGMSFDLETWVDPQVWDEAVGLMHQASSLLHESARPPRTDGTVHVSASGVAFAMGTDS